MSKYALDWNEEKFQKYLKEGRGQGRGDEYKPWITIHDFPSKGKSSRTPGWNSSRVFHFVSKKELNYFYILQWCDQVIDIREQYPLLDIDTAMQIAEELEIKYPIDSKTGAPKVLTTDFMITMNVNGNEIDIARTIKPTGDIENRRVLEKFEIERRYWKSKNIDWGIVTEKDIPERLVQNIAWVHNAYHLEDTDGFKKGEAEYALRFLKRKLKEPGKKIKDILEFVDYELNLSKGCSLSLYRHLIARKDVVLDMVNDIGIDNYTNIIIEIKQKDDKVEAI